MLIEFTFTYIHNSYAIHIWSIRKCREHVTRTYYMCGLIDKGLPERPCVYIQDTREHGESCPGVRVCVEIRLTVDAAILAYSLSHPRLHNTLLKTHF